ncbi:hypothetical protein [Siphonobacter sp. BAB-5405]|uniref:hypothetical protein n=1 Tax=Siphonobacter sp. BAB-5405 TaxID=1864825 RepID=UPI0011AF1451|nr:hypothetical protein [Siphonobacter sp. BAB-5405]
MIALGVFYNKNTLEVLITEHFTHPWVEAMGPEWIGFALMLLPLAFTGKYMGYYCYGLFIVVYILAQLGNPLQYYF